MTQTEIYDKLDDIRQEETRELVEALKAHGGSYSWEEDGEDAPIIDVRRRILDTGVEEVVVVGISLIANFTILLTGRVLCTDHLIDFTNEEVLVGELIGIINYIK